MKINEQSEKKNKTIGRVVEILLTVLCLAAALGIRMAYLWSGQVTVTDSFGYFEHAMIQAEQKVPLLTSGVSFAYTESLSFLFQFMGNKTEIIPVYHVLLQMLACFFLMTGCKRVFGKAAAYVAGISATLLPGLIRNTACLSPESFYLFWWSFGLLLTGIYYQRAKKAKENQKLAGIPVLAFAGAVAGVLSIWHSLGLLLLVCLLYSVVRNIWGAEKKNLWFIPVFLLGVTAGAAAVLMKYAQLAQTTFAEQFFRWQEQMCLLINERLQDMALWFSVWLLAVLLVGMITAAVTGSVKNSKKEMLLEEKDVSEEKMPVLSEEKIPEEKAEPEITIPEEPEKLQTEEHQAEKQPDPLLKTITYIENPLPLPKKHVPKTMDFKWDEEKKNLEDDFDIEVDVNDDFDI